MSYNFLKDARTIENSFLCVYDTLDGYSSDFGENGNVNGWDVYNNVYLYGCWNNMLFGHSYDRDCYIGRTNIFSPLDASKYYHVRILMKITNNNSNKLVQGLTTGKLRWTRTVDSVWNSDKEIEFDIISDNKWHLYDINVGPEQYWQSSINNLRVYPFIDGWSGDEFAIKYIKISSLDEYRCTNTSCSYYVNYSHPCAGAGSRGSCEAATAKNSYSTVSGINDVLMVNIGGYGYESINLGNNSGLNGVEMARLVAEKLSDLNIGGYSYATCKHNDLDRLQIYSGTVGSDSDVVVSGTAAEALGFFENGSDVSVKESGVDSATGFDYASARLLTAREISKLVDGTTDEAAYTHNPDQFSVEGGRRDFNEIGVPILTSDIIGNNYYTSLNNTSKTLIDYSHPVDNNGRLKHIYVFGKANINAKVKILRPLKDGRLKVIHSLDFPTEDSGYLYTTKPIVYRIDCDILVQRGDLLGVYNANFYVGRNLRNLPDATFVQMLGNVSGTFTPGEPFAFGVSGFAIYARGDRRQNNTILDIDLGDRINIENVNIYGTETSGYVEFNIASCLDVGWNVDTFGLSHRHTGINLYTSLGWAETHLNLAYGVDALSDSIYTADNGQQGDTYNSGSNGMETYGHHSYCYVDGDAEWLYNFECDGKHEFCNPYAPNETSGFKYDPIAYTLEFPYGYSATIHKSIIYFKERDNFRNMSLSYYLGGGNANGNADNPFYQYIPEYTSIRLDGLLYTPDEEAIANEYIFSNPMDDRLEYADGNQNPINWENFRSSSFTDWNIIEHNFDDVSCYGFRVYTNKHNSTKIIEMELYSKIYMASSLVDNVSIVFSNYGDVWNSSDFTEINNNKIVSFLGGSPRYITLEFEASAEFSLNEIEFEVGDQVKLEECNDVVNLDHARSNTVNTATPIVLENVYGKTFDLYVDLPNDALATDNVVFWSKLGSMDELTYPEIGPGTILHKQDDYTILNDNRQCAINCPSYGLKNLIHNRNSYVMETINRWDEYETLSSGVSINYHNANKSYKETLLSFPAVSTSYWKLVHDHNMYGGNYFNIDGIVAYYNGNEVDITDVFIYSDSDHTTQKYTTTHDGGLDIWGGIIRDDITDEWVLANPNNWTAYGSNGDEARWELTHSHFEVIDFGVGDGGPTIEYEFDNMTDFTIDLGFIIYRSSQYQMSRVKLFLYDETDTEVLELSMINVWNSRLNHEYTDLFSEGSKVFGTVDIQNYMYHDTDNINSLILKRSGSNLIFKVNGTTFYNNTFSITEVSKIKITMERTASYGPAIKGAFYFGSDETTGFAVSSEPIDTIKIRHAGNLPVAMEIWTSPDNGNNYGSITDFMSYILNEYDKSSDITLSEDFLTANHTGGWGAVRSFFSKNSGKWYWECTIGNVDGYNRSFIGIGTIDETLIYPGYTNEGYGYYGRNGKKYSSSSSNYGDTFTTGDVIGTALNLNSGEIWWSKNGIWQNGGVPASGVNPAYSGISGDFYPMIGLYSTSDVTINFGETSFVYSPPQGFKKPYVAPTLQDIDYDYTNETYYDYFAIDLNQRHNLEIIRNYGSLDDKLFLSKSIGIIDYSNTDVADPDLVDWNNSTFNDARWIRIHILTGDDNLRYLDKIGIYPDITEAYAPGGGYNCEWESMGNILSDYTASINVAYGATVTGTNNYFLDQHPSNAVDGVYSDYQKSACWAFQVEDGIDPYIEIDFGQTYLINRVILYHGYDPEVYTYMNNDYEFSVSTTTTGSFSNVFSVSGNTEHYRLHQFDPIYARRARLKITDYDTQRVITRDRETGLQYIFEGSYLREVEIYNYVDNGYVDSENWPIICMNLKDQFDITGHDLINKDVNDTDTNWDNNEEFFMYSDDALDDPKKVSFTSEGEYETAYETSISSGDRTGDYEYIFDDNVYFEAGRYFIEYEAYKPTYNDEISVQLDGPIIINHYATETGSDWEEQEGIIEIDVPGYYSVKALQNLEPTYSWGVRNIHIYQSAGLRKWIAVTRDTAEDYSYGDDSDKYGTDYLSLIKVYGNVKHVPTEYSWWWSSTISTLDNDSLRVKTGRRSLKISYPTSSGSDIVNFIEGDDFGTDDYFTAKDFLHFWWYLPDINKIDTSFGDVSFGDMNSADAAYYTWSINNMNLISGWNEVKLKFEDADSVYPVQSIYQELSNFFDNSMDFAKKDCKSIQLRYRGIGASFNMYIDGFEIVRNVFDDDVAYGKGLCLTGYDYLDIPISNATVSKGAIEFWVKPYTDFYGRDKFENFNSRTFFTLINNNNNIVSLGIKSGKWLELIVGHSRKNLNLLDIDPINLPSFTIFDINDVVHIGVVWSHDGTDMDNDDTTRLYINGELICINKTQWDIADSKISILRLGGCTAGSALNQDTYGSAIFDNIKIYNYCKTDFNINYEGIDKDIRYTPNDFLEISKDNITFYDVTSSGLPFIFDKVPAGDSRTIYVRANKNDNFKQSKNTANLIVDWLITA